MPERNTYERHRRRSTRPTSSVRRTYDLLRAAIPTLDGETQLREDDLVRDLAASRGTVRTVLRLLADQGLLIRKQRSGTTIRPTLVSRAVFDDVGPCGLDPAFAVHVQGRVIDLTVGEAPEVVRQRLNLEPGAIITIVEEVMCYEGDPFGISVMYLAFELDRQPRPGDQLPGTIDFLESEVHARLRERETVMGAGACDASSADLLGVAEGTPLLWRETLLCDGQGHPRMLVIVRNRADRVVFRATTRQTFDPEPGE